MNEKPVSVKVDAQSMRLIRAIRNTRFPGASLQWVISEAIRRMAKAKK